MPGQEWLVLGTGGAMSNTSYQARCTHIWEYPSVRETNKEKQHPYDTIPDDRGPLLVLTRQMPSPTTIRTSLEVQSEDSVASYQS